MSKTILVVDDEETIRFSMAEGLKDKNYRVFTAADGKTASAIMHEKDIDLVLLDIRLPDTDGVTLLKKIRLHFPDVIVIMMTAYGDTESTVACIKAGAYYYLNKPFDIEEIFFQVKKAFEKEKLEKEAVLYRAQQLRLHGGRFIGESEKMKEIFDKIELVANSPTTTVLIEGETGTGKDLAARAIHAASKRKDHPFIEINCGGIPHNLLEAELFGYEKNAFTGAERTKKGLVELADGGTLFLDEIGELPLEMQSRLLHFLENKTIKRVGGVKNIPLDVRVVAATNRHLQDEVANKRFRADLYYRINVFPITMPPLRERKADIKQLVDYFMGEYFADLYKGKKELTAAALNALCQYNWPGNVRELKNVLERVILQHQHDAVIDVEHLPQDIIASSSDDVTQVRHSKAEAENSDDPLMAKIMNEGIDAVLQEKEKAYLKKFLDMTHWNVSKTAQLVGLNRHTLKRRIDAYFPRKK